MSLFTITVPAHTTAVQYRHGAFDTVLESGRHPLRSGTTRVLVERRETLLPLALQDVLSADGLSVRVSATLRLSVADPVAFVEKSADPYAVVYLAAQVALREGLAGLSAEEIGQRGAPLPVAAMIEAVGAVAATVGLAVLEIVVKDIVLPPDLRAAQLEVVTARARGLARLEAARAETAALRTLANGAALLDKHPALARLRLVQSAPYGSQVVVKVKDT